MRPDTIIIHCSATKENADVPVERIDQMHRERKFRRPVQTEPLKYIGYHYYVRKDGTVHAGRQETETGAHCIGWNNRSIGICYEGGLDVNGRAKDTRTPAQIARLKRLVNDICSRWEIIKVIGHRDTSPDANGNGKVDPWERLKECPCFEVITEFESFLKPITVMP